MTQLLAHSLSPMQWEGQSEKKKKSSKLWVDIKDSLIIEQNIMMMIIIVVVVLVVALVVVVVVPGTHSLLYLGKLALGEQFAF